jgi:hypothetical protein
MATSEAVPVAILRDAVLRTAPQDEVAKSFASPESAKGGAQMPAHFDHLTIVVRDIDRAKTFFAILGFKEAISVVIAGETFASYLGVPGRWALPAWR